MPVFMLMSLHRSRWRGICGAALAGAFATSVSPSALAQGDGAPPPGQKPPCIPASSYMLSYDCELFPLPGLPGAAAGAAAPAVVPAGPAAAAVAVVPAGTAPAASEAPAPAASPATSSSSSSDGPSHAPAYVAFAVGAGGIGMTVAFGVLALSNKSTLNGECSSGNTCPSTASSTVNSLKTDGILADVGLGVAVAGIALGAILFATEHGPSTASGARHVEPYIGLGAAGLRGSF